MTVVDLSLEGGLAFVGDRLGAFSIAVHEGRVAGIFAGTDSVPAERRIDIGGHVVLPGLIDAHVHLRDPGPTYKEDLSSGTRAAAAGGFTLVADMPNCWPTTKGASAIMDKSRSIEERAYVDVAIWAAATAPEEVEAASETGAVGIKAFLNGPVNADSTSSWDPSVSSHNPELAITSYAQLMAIAESAARYRLPLAVHLGEQSILDAVRGSWGGRSFGDILDELESESMVEKRVAAAACLEIARETGVWLHVVHVPGAVIPLISLARQQGLTVTAESFFPFMSFAMANKLGPLGFNRYKTEDEMDDLWGWIRDGTIDILASDHAPHTLEEKERGHEDILRCPSGYPELETSTAMMLNEVAESRLRLDVLVRRMSTEPARILGMAHCKGKIEVGYDADFTIVDPNVVWTLGSRPYETKCGWSPFTGLEVQGRVESTIVRGVPVFEADEIVGAAGHGNHATPQR